MESLCRSWVMGLLRVSSLLIGTLSTNLASRLSFGDSCELNFMGFSYEPMGDCVNFGKNPTDPTPRCCINALTMLTRAIVWLPRQLVHQTRPVVGLRQKFHEAEALVSMESCGHDELFYGSSHCSRSSLSGIVGRQSFVIALKECSNFNSSFDEACQKGIHLIMTLRDYLMELYHVNGDRTEEKVCEVAVLIAIAGAKLDEPELISEFGRCVPSLDNIGSDNYFTIKTSVVRSISAVFLITAAIWAALKLIIHLKRKKPAKFIQQEDFDACSGLYRFSKPEIENAMNIGNEKDCLGRGSAGHVYTGTQPSGQEVAIKHIIRQLSSTFKREVEGLSRVHHPNLICLFGCCVEDDKQYLVYECPGGNLSECLQREDVALTWEMRVKILRDCSVAHRYLHHYIDGCMVH